MRAWALDNGHPELAEPLLPADERRASDLSALAALIKKAEGFYNPVNSAVVPIITFGEVTVGHHPTSRQVTIRGAGRSNWD